MCGCLSAHYFTYCRKGMTASQILEAKRRRWGIRNQLHWMLDMQFRKNESRVGSDNSALCGSFSDKQFHRLLDEPFPDKSSVPPSAHDLFTHSITLLTVFFAIAFPVPPCYAGKHPTGKDEFRCIYGNGSWTTPWATICGFTGGFFGCESGRGTACWQMY